MMINKKVICKIVIALVFVVGGGYSCSYVAARGGSGSGGTAGESSNGCPDDMNKCLCNKNHTWVQNCDNVKAKFNGIDDRRKMGGLGGASWHMFRTSDDYDKTYCKERDKKGNCTKKHIGTQLFKGVVGPKYSSANADGYGKNLATTCKYGAGNNNDDGYVFYIAYVWDGWEREGVDTAITASPVYWGPIGWKTQKYTPYYHDDGANSETDALAAFSNGATDVRITKSLAGKLYKTYMKKAGFPKKEWTTKIPDGTGFFCYAGDLYGEYEGKVTVTGSVNHDMSFTQVSPSTQYYEAGNCATSGCNVSFNHYVQQQPKNVGDGESVIYDETSYSISRTTNDQIVTFIRSSTETKSNVVVSDVVTMYPGMKVCETLNFDTNDGEKGEVSIPVCVIATGDAASSDLNMKVRNEDVNAYKSYMDIVYAKPKDKVTYQATYGPNVQKHANNVTSKMIINNGAICSRNMQVASTLLSACGGGTWRSGFSVFSEYFVGMGFNKNYSRQIGDTNRKAESNTHTVQGSEVGRSLNETAITNTGISTVPRAAYWTMGWFGDVAYPTLSVDTTQMKDDARVLVPYNFETDTCILEGNNTGNNDCTGDGRDTKTVFAGESAKFDIKIDVKKRSNVTLNGEYATIVRDAKWKIGFRLGDDTNYNWTSPKSGNLNTAYNTDNVTEVKNGFEINIPDVTAGSKICVRSAVYPKDSFGDLNMRTDAYDVNNMTSWKVSPETCYLVAKKPSLQVWGGNVYSGGNINTAVANKRSLDGITEYSANVARGTYVFGSWGELGVINSGVTVGFGSGASLGYAGNSNGSLIPNYQFVGSDGNTASYNGLGNKGIKQAGGGGKDPREVCLIGPLTFAECGIEGIGNSISTNNAKTDKTALIDTYIYGGSGNNISSESGNVSLNSGGNVIDGVRYYYNKDEDGTGFTINEPQTVDPDTIQIVHSTGNIMINGDIKYADTSTYNNFNDLSKLVIYAEKDIYIGCNVERIDAVLIAGKGSNDGNVITCADSKGKQPEVNSQERSRQLRINGAVIANKLTPNRTYGAATGANSIIPAEIINFDPTLYLWGGGDSVNSEGRNTNMDITYTRELAPRL